MSKEFYCQQTRALRRVCEEDIGMQRECRRRTNIGAFTLVELLVVVSIIALLISILLPSVSRAKDRAKQMVCSANLRGISQAGLVYAADDPGENMVPIGPRDGISSSSRFSSYGFGGKSGRGHGKMSNPNQSDWSGANHMGSIHRPLNNVLFKGGLTGPQYGGGGVWPPPTDTADWTADSELNLELFHCPADREFSGMHFAGWRDSKLSSYDYFGTSYAANPMYIYDPQKPTKLFTNSLYNRPLSRVPTPSNTVAYWENSARFATFADWPANVKDQSCREFFSAEDGYIAKGWHKKPWWFNMAYGDGHSAWVQIRGYDEVTGIQNLSTCGTNNQRCVCVIVRGSGWQLDTLPAPFVKTDKIPNSGGRRVPLPDKGNSIYDIVP